MANDFVDDSRKLLEEIISDYYPKIWENNYYLLNGSTSDADDLTQSVFMVLAEKWDNLEKTNIGAWLYGVARRKLYEFYRSKKKESKNVISIELLKIDPQQYDEAIDSYLETSDDTINKIKNEILDMLSEDERKLYEEYFENGVPYEKIMQMYSISYSAATSRVNRLKEKINHYITIKSASLYSLGFIYFAMTLSLMKDFFNGR